MKNWRKLGPFIPFIMAGLLLKRPKEKHEEEMYFQRKITYLNRAKWISDALSKSREWIIDDSVWKIHFKIDLKNLCVWHSIFHFNRLWDIFFLIITGWGNVINKPGLPAQSNKDYHKIQQFHPRMVIQNSTRKFLSKAVSLTRFKKTELQSVQSMDAAKEELIWMTRKYNNQDKCWKREDNWKIAPLQDLSSIQTRDIWRSMHLLYIN